jgi:hypothetical protein
MRRFVVIIYSLWRIGPVTRNIRKDNESRAKISLLSRSERESASWQYYQSPGLLSKIQQCAAGGFDQMVWYVRLEGAKWQ